jgi:hypothetical protein
VTSAAEARQDRRQKFEREVNRKDEALAETAAFLVLSNKPWAVFHERKDA